MKKKLKIKQKNKNLQTKVHDQMVSQLNSTYFQRRINTNPSQTLPKARRGGAILKLIYKATISW